jgi:precorrin-6Y C5,15-methyltransferase (decarboxylating)
MTQPDTQGVTSPWLSIIGVGEDGADGLSSAARTLVAQAKLIVGGARHLALMRDVNTQKLAWPSPLTDALPALLARRGEPVVVLASGDPFYFGVGELLSRHVQKEEVFCLPAPSAFALAAARLKWSQQDCACLSLHGRAFARIIPHLQPRARIIALSWDETTPAQLASHLKANGMGASQLHVLERMGGPNERIRSTSARDFNLADIAALNTVAIEITADASAQIIPRVAGLPDDWFENDGQLTKRDIRAMTLSALAPRRGELLWDIGAGAGSVSIEWMLRDPANRAIAIEKHPDRAARITRNALALGVPDLTILTGDAPQCLDELTQPHAIFIGGGANEKTLATAWAALPSQGRIVVNAVTLETQALLAQHYAQKGGELIEINISRARAVGSFHGLEPAMAVMQWRGVKS